MIVMTRYDFYTHSHVNIDHVFLPSALLVFRVPVCLAVVAESLMVDRTAEFRALIAHTPKPPLALPKQVDFGLIDGFMDG